MNSFGLCFPGATVAVSWSFPLLLYEGFVPLYSPSLFDPIVHLSVIQHGTWVSTYFLTAFDFLGIKIPFNTVQGSSPHRCGQVSSCDAFNAVVAAFFQDISASLSLPCALVIYLYLWNFLEGGLKESQGSSRQQTSCPRRVFLSDQPPWMLTRSTVNYNGPLWFLLLGRIVDETLFLGLDHGPIFYSPTSFNLNLQLKIFFTHSWQLITTYYL